MNAFRVGLFIDNDYSAYTSAVRVCASSKTYLRAARILSCQGWQSPEARFNVKAILETINDPQRFPLKPMSPAELAEEALSLIN